MWCTNLAIFLVLYGAIYIRVIKAITPYQYVVDIRVNNVHQCIGTIATILSKYHVVTVASCVATHNIKTLKVYMMNKNGETHTTDVEEKLLHPRFEENKRIYNLALLKLAKLVSLLAGHAALVLPNKVSQCCECVMHFITQECCAIETIEVNCLAPNTCRETHEQIRKAHLWSEMFVCMESNADKCIQEHGFIFVCNRSYLVGIGLQGTSWCGKRKPYLGYNMLQFRNWVLHGKERDDSSSLFQEMYLLKVYMMINMLVHFGKFMRNI